MKEELLSKRNLDLMIGKILSLSKLQKVLKFGASLLEKVWSVVITKSMALQLSANAPEVVNGQSIRSQGKGSLKGLRM